MSDATEDPHDGGREDPRDGGPEGAAPSGAERPDGADEPDGAGAPQPPDDATLGGYFRTHDRPPAYEGPDGHPYTVSVEVERTSNLRAPFAGYLVFPRWAQSGVGIVGHVETPTLVESGTEEEATLALGRIHLLEVQRLLAEAVARKAREDE